MIACAMATDGAGTLELGGALNKKSSLDVVNAASAGRSQQLGCEKKKGNEIITVNYGPRRHLSLNIPCCSLNAVLSVMLFPSPIFVFAQARAPTPTKRKANGLDVQIQYCCYMCGLNGMQSYLSVQHLHLFAGAYYILFFCPLVSFSPRSRRSLTLA